MRERGLKDQVHIASGASCHVAPYAGAWIERKEVRNDYMDARKSLPMRERGLKEQIIEKNMLDLGRSLCGSVD